jgi:hypothetical protein
VAAAIGRWLGWTLIAVVLALITYGLNAGLGAAAAGPERVQWLQAATHDARAGEVAVRSVARGSLVGQGRSPTPTPAP